MVDVAIIGAGVTGCLIARSLSRYQVSIFKMVTRRVNIKQKTERT